MTYAIRQAATAADLAQARALFEEYAAWLKVDLCFQGFAEELTGLPGAYAPPRGRLLLAGHPAAVGCVALRPLAVAGEVPGPVGEVKRLYVRDEARGQGLGRQLVLELLAQSDAIGYRTLMLDTLEWMTHARGVYAQLGFRPCPPYYDNPLPGVVYMSNVRGAR